MMMMIIIIIIGLKVRYVGEYVDRLRLKREIHSI